MGSAIIRKGIGRSWQQFTSGAEKESEAVVITFPTSTTMESDILEALGQLIKPQPNGSPQSMRPTLLSGERE
jgi:hypothetical protein